MTFETEPKKNPPESGGSVRLYGAVQVKTWAKMFSDLRDFTMNALFNKLMNCLFFGILTQLILNSISLD